MSRRHTILFAALALAALILSACGAAAPEIQEVSYTATEYSFEGPAEIEAGLTRIRLDNEGQELHHAQLIRLGEGMTMDDLGAAMQEGRVPESISWQGGASVAVPGGGVSAVVDLEPGSYVLLCVIPDSEGTPHAQHGMVMPVQVTEDGAQQAEPPEADLTMTLRDFEFELSESVSAGEQTIHVVNEGPQPHEVAVVQLAPDASVEDFMAAIQPGSESEGPPPGMPVGGLQVIDSGDEGYFTTTFESGSRYALICFHPDQETGQPHAALGMVQTFTVE
ncbi:MAG: hypothetical protein R3191_03630 [Anaerolineales bacterium]|nr:hypothetical protein [Anaerolineales bacterium]